MSFRIKTFQLLPVEQKYILKQQVIIWCFTFYVHVKSFLQLETKSIQSHKKWSPNIKCHDYNAFSHLVWLLIGFLFCGNLLWYVCSWVRPSEVGVMQEIQMVVATSSDEKFGGTCNCEQLGKLEGGMLERRVAAGHICTVIWAFSSLWPLNKNSVKWFKIY